MNNGQAPPAAPPWGNFPHPWSFADAARKKADRRAEAFVASRAAERAYARQLRSVATRVQSVLATTSPEEAGAALDAYARVLEPWATRAAANMVLLADKKNREAFQRAAAKAGLDMRVLLHSPGVGQVTRERIADNVTHIRSIVTHARDQVATLVEESLSSGMRAETLAKRIAHVGEVALSRARTIAATEVSKASTALTRARAEDVGSEGYIWRTARDGDVRESHRAMEGRFVKWNEPPTLDNMTGHAGEFPNDRCYPEPVLKRDDGSTIASTLPGREEELEAGEKTLYSQWERTPGSPVIALAPDEALPGADRPQGVAGKLTAYSLNPDHERGGHKARVFASALGITQDHAELLQKQLEALLPHLKPKPHTTDVWGQRFNVIVPVTGPNGRTVDVTTAWIYDRSKDGKSISLHPRMTTAMIKD